MVVFEIESSKKEAPIKKNIKNIAGTTAEITIKIKLIKFNLVEYLLESDFCLSIMVLDKVLRLSDLFVPPLVTVSVI